jgi:hypothetical protein
VKQIIFLMAFLAMSGCAKAQQTTCCTSGFTWGTGEGYCCGQSGVCSPCAPSAPDYKRVPDVKKAPSELPAYGERVLLWTGESWVIAKRIRTDKDGDCWDIEGAQYMLSKKRPMWQSLPSEPQGTPMCTAIVGGSPKAWLPKNGICKVEDAP